MPESNLDRDTSTDDRGIVRPLSIAVQVYESLRRRITEGRLKEESPVVISTLATEFGISSTPVREALARLHAEGLVTFTSNVGYRIAARPTEADYRYWMQARLAIEVGAMRCIEAPVPADELDRLSAINGSIAAEGFGANFEGARRFSELNREFHRQLILLCRNPFLAKAYEQIWLGAQFSRVHFDRGVNNQSKIVREHQMVIDALREGRIEAACDLLTHHIVESLNRDASATRHAKP